MIKAVVFDMDHTLFDRYATIRAVMPAFCEAFEKNGFRRVSSLTRNDIDCFVQVGADVGFVWQNIDQ